MSRRLAFRIIFFVLVATILLACRPGPIPSHTPQPTPTLTPPSPADPPDHPSTPSPTLSPFQGEGPWSVTLTAADGVTLSGTLFGRPDAGWPTVVFSHMYLGDQSDWHPLATTLAQQGYTALTFDLRGYGNSAGERRVTDAPQDLLAALAFLRQHNPGPLVLIGAGIGGMASIQIAARDEHIAGLAVISAPRSFEGLEITDADLAALSLPTLWIGTRNDLTQHVEEMYNLVPGEDRELWIYEGSSLHGTFILEGADGPDLERRLLEFVSRVLATP